MPRHHDTPAHGSGTDPWPDAPTALDVLSTSSRERLTAIAGRSAYEAGDVILRDGASTPFLGLVEAGRVGLRLSVPDRGIHTVVTIEPGELVGWSAVVPPYRATAEAVALEPTRLETYDAAALRSLLLTDRDLAAELLPVVLAAVSARLTTSWHQLLDLFGTGTVQPW